MFDLGFSEILVIALVALVVLGPERMPRVTRTIGRYVARGQGYISQIKDEFDREVEDADLRDVRDTFVSAGEALESDIRSSVDEIGKGLEQEDIYARFNRSEAFAEHPEGNGVSHDAQVSRVVARNAGLRARKVSAGKAASQRAGTVKGMRSKVWRMTRERKWASK